MRLAIITPGITDLNRGDQALIWLIEDILRKTNVPVEVRLLQSGNSEDDIYMQSRQSVDMGYTVMPPILLHPSRGNETRSVDYSFITKLKWGLTALKDLVTSSMLLSKWGFLNSVGESRLDSKRRQTYQSFKEMDLLVVKGGGFLHTYNRITDIYYLYYSLFNIMLAQRLGKRVVIFPNSFGPFLGNIEKHIIRKVLNKCDLIFAREDISRRYLQDLLDREVHYAPDLGFSISSRKNMQFDDDLLPKLRTKVAVTMRPYRFPEYSDGDKRYQRYIDEMFLLSKSLIEKGYHPVYVAHTIGPSAHEDDRIALNEVIERLTKAGISRQEYSYIDIPEMNCFDITRLYSKVDYIIGTRFHSVIFAMVSLTPPIAISYSGNKTVGIMKDIGLEEFVVDISEMDAGIVLEKFEKLVSESDNVKNKIKHYLGKCDSYNEKLVDMIKGLL